MTTELNRPDPNVTMNVSFADRGLVLDATVFNAIALWPSPAVSVKSLPELTFTKVATFVPFPSPIVSVSLVECTLTMASTSLPSPTPPDPGSSMLTVIELVTLVFTKVKTSLPPANSISMEVIPLPVPDPKVNELPVAACRDC